MQDSHCEHCTERSKYVTGFWDGIDPKTGKEIHGCNYGCKNEACAVKIKQDELYQESEKRCRRTRIENLNAGVSMMELESMQHAHPYSTNMEMARELGVSPATYSAWVNERDPMPPEMYAKARSYLRNKRRK